MLIGGDFNSEAKQLLDLIGVMSGNNPETEVPAEDLVNQLKLSRTALKGLLEYLEARGLIEIVSIGGPFLYGHIKITEKGILKASKLK